MQKASGMIALLLIAAILLMPTSPEIGRITETPLTVSGVSPPQSEPVTQENEADGTATIIAVVVVVIIVILIIYCFTGTESNQAVRR